MKHLLSIASIHLWALVPILFSCTTKTSLPEALFIVFCNAITCLYASSLKGYTMDISPVAVDSTGHFDMAGRLPLPLLGVGLH